MFLACRLFVVDSAFLCFDERRMLSFRDVFLFACTSDVVERGLFGVVHFFVSFSSTFSKRSAGSGIS